jgi:hypothetical protein
LFSNPPSQSQLFGGSLLGSRGDVPIQLFSVEIKVMPSPGAFGPNQLQVTLKTNGSDQANHGIFAAFQNQMTVMIPTTTLDYNNGLTISGTLSR